MRSLDTFRICAIIVFGVYAKNISYLEEEILYEKNMEKNRRCREYMRGAYFERLFGGLSE
jgi:hypothetical protein